MMNHNMLKKFSGEIERYDYWRSSFMANVHRQAAPFEYKIQALSYSLVDTVEGTEQIIHDMGSTPAECYAAIVEHLEDEYGGTERTLSHKYALIDRVPKIKVGSKADLQALFSFLTSYKAVLTHYKRPLAFNNHVIFDDCFLRLPDLYQEQFHEWAAIHATKPFSASHLLLWGKVKIASVRFVAEKRALGERRDALLLEANNWAPIKGPAQMKIKPQTDPHHSFLASGRGPKPKQKPPGPTSSCDCCSARPSHKFIVCQKFTKMTPSQRIKVIRNSNRCFVCFGSHNSRDCTADRPCKLCDGKHHPLLHGGEFSSRVTFVETQTEIDPDFTQADVPSDEEEVEEPATGLEKVPSPTVSRMNFICFVDTDDRVSLRTLSGWVINPYNKRRLLINILLDDGSTMTALSTDAANRLRLKTVVSRTGPLAIKTAGGHLHEYAALSSRIIFASTSSKFRHGLITNIIPTPAGDLEPIDWHTHAAQWPALKRAKFSKLASNMRIDAIIGLDHKIFHRTIPGSVEVHASHGPDARLTHMGWTAVGRSLQSSKPASHLRRMFFIRDLRRSAESAMDAVSATIIDQNLPDGTELQLRDDLSLTQLLTRSWELDRPKKPSSPFSPKDREVHALMKRKRRFINGRFEMPVLWRPGEPSFTSNFVQAKSRLDSLLNSRKMLVPEKRAAYSAAIEKLIREKFIIPVPPSKLREHHRYLSHFAAEKKNDPSKVRPVMDAAEKFNGKSLNDAIYPGPKLCNDLPEVMMRFRARNVGLTTDVSDMFLRVRMPAEDQPFHRILWRDAQGSLQHFQHTCQVFGNTSAPSNCIFVAKQNAEDNMEAFPRAAEAVLSSSIVDDVTDSENTVEETVVLVSQLVSLFAKADMAVRKWACSDKTVLVDIPESDRARTFFHQKEQAIMVLGVRWIPASDMFTFHLDPPERRRWTPKQIISFFLSCYDPHGLVAPYIMWARKAFQAIWLKHPHWDRYVPELALKDWMAWLSHLGELDFIRVPRCVGKKRALEDVVDRQIHVFCDASEVGFGAVSYVRTEYADGDLHMGLALSRGKVAPTVHKSIPKLELAATVVGLGVAETLCSSMGIPMVIITFWTDSQVAICWIYSESRVFGPFVAGRVGMLHDSIAPSQVRFVDTDRNPADLVSRGTSPDFLRRSLLWNHGPDFLNVPGMPPPPPPTFAKTPEVVKEVKKGQEFGLLRMLHLTAPAPPKDGYTGTPTFRPHPSDCSNYRSMVAAIALFRQWLRLVRGQTNTFRIGPTERQQAETVMLRLCQKECLAKAFHDLRVHNVVSVRSPFARHSPRLDESGLLRGNARLNSAEFLSHDARHPIILHKSHPVVRLLLVHIHSVVLNHVGGEATLKIHFLKRFAVNCLTSHARYVMRKCVHCKRITATPNHQKMAPIPNERVAPSSERLLPYHTCGVDALGPFTTLNDDVFSIRYVILFTCSLYRAVHVEIVSTLSTDMFLAAFSRFLARNPRPAVMRSDRATQFIRADYELRLLWDAIKEDICSMRHPDISWRFLDSARSPHQGGVWERMVLSLKRAVYVTLPPGMLTDEEFHTVFVVAEGTMNNRPLGELVSTDPADPEPLTPAHFTRGGPIQDASPLPEGISYPLYRRWYFLQIVLNHFWARFIKEITPYYNALNKWIRPNGDLREGDLVLNLDTRCRGRWPVARVHRIRVSKLDGKVRNVVVRYKSRLYLRSVHQLLLLDTTSVWAQPDAPLDLADPNHPAVTAARTRQDEVRTRRAEARDAENTTATPAQ